MFSTTRTCRTTFFTQLQKARISILHANISISITSNFSLVQNSHCLYVASLGNLQGDIYSFAFAEQTSLNCRKHCYNLRKRIMNQINISKLIKHAKENNRIIQQNERSRWNQRAFDQEMRLEWHVEIGQKHLQTTIMFGAHTS